MPRERSRAHDRRLDERRGGETGAATISQQDGGPLSAATRKARHGIATAGEAWRRQSWPNGPVMGHPCDIGALPPRSFASRDPFACGHWVPGAGYPPVVANIADTGCVRRSSDPFLAFSWQWSSATGRYGREEPSMSNSGPECDSLVSLPTRRSSRRGSADRMADRRR